MVDPPITRVDDLIKSIRRLFTDNWYLNRAIFIPMLIEQRHAIALIVSCQSASLIIFMYDPSTTNLKNEKDLDGTSPGLSLLRELKRKWNTSPLLKTKQLKVQ